jgi:hypothetical protein
MLRKRSARALAGGLTAVLLLGSVATALAAVTGAFSGRTSQKQPISFRVAHGYVTHLQFHINVRCPNGDIWNVFDRGFSKIKINKFHKFGKRFTNTDSPTQAEAEIKGTVFQHRVTGSLFGRQIIEKEQHFCSGRATFSLRKH